MATINTNYKPFIQNYEIVSEPTKDLKFKVNNSEEVCAYALKLFKKCLNIREEFKVLYLNRSNHVIGKYNLSSGGIHGTVVDSKLLWNVALKKLATSVILLHNHPSGQLRPSQEDLNITKMLVEQGKILGIVVFDHLIISDAGYYSFMDEGEQCLGN